MATMSPSHWLTARPMKCSNSPATSIEHSFAESRKLLQRVILFSIIVRCTDLLAKRKRKLQLQGMTSVKSNSCLAHNDILGGT